MDALLILCGFLLILGTGFFVAVEFSLVALDQPAAQRAADEGQKGAAALVSNLKSLSTQLSSCQLGITLTTLLTGYLLEAPLTRLLSGPMMLLGLEEKAASAISLVTGMLIATLGSMLVGELIPKNLAIAIPLRIGRLVSPPQRAFTAVFRPVVVGLNGMANWILGLFGLEAKEEITGARTPAELSSMVKRSAEMGTLDEGTANFLSKTLSFSEKTAADVMTPRIHMQTLEAGQTAQDVIASARATGHSRFPLIEDSPDDVRGVVHVKKAVAVPVEKRAEVPTGALMTDILRVPETIHLDSLLVQLRDAELQMAVVQDEYGGTAGIVTLEDLVEEIVGEVADEHDRARTTIRRIPGGEWMIPAITRPHELLEHLPRFEINAEGSYETLGGFMMEGLGRVPAAGDTLEVAGGTLTVVRMDGRRIDRVRFTPVAGGVAGGPPRESEDSE